MEKVFNHWGIRVILYFLFVIPLFIYLPQSEDGKTNAVLSVITLFLYLCIIIFEVIALAMVYSLFNNENILISTIVASVSICFVFFIFVMITHTGKVFFWGKTDLKIFKLNLILFNVIEIINYFFKKNIQK